MGQPQSLLSPDYIRPLCANCRHSLIVPVHALYCSLACYNAALALVPLPWANEAATERGFRVDHQTSSATGSGFRWPPESGA